MRGIFRRRLSAGACLLFVFFFISSYAQDTTQVADTPAAGADQELISAGQTLFNNNCKVCHAIHEQVVGPALAGVTARRPTDWLYSFIRNSQKMIQSGDEYAVSLYQEYNQTMMPSFDFSDEELNALLAYIDVETENTPAFQTTPGGDVAAGGTATTTSTAISSTYLTIFLIALLVVLVLILVVLVMLVSVLTKYIKEKRTLDQEDTEVVESKTNYRQILTSPALIFLVTFIFTAIALKTVIDGLFNVGIQEGYAPTQPIAFSHKLHAGQYQIDCQYCHTGVSVSQSANIPSVNICLNCHQQIVRVEGSTEMSVEIQKIHDAAQNDTPIEWVRVHNLPDLAYFNHAQHYNVGGIQCQTCHGPIEEMEVVRQHSSLTMGWCIDCHRKTEVKTGGNEYYDRLVELHNKYSNEPLLVEDIGGVECSKCHY